MAIVARPQLEHVQLRPSQKAEGAFHPECRSFGLALILEDVHVRGISPNLPETVDKVGVFQCVAHLPHGFAHGGVVEQALEGVAWDGYIDVIVPRNEAAVPYGAQ